MPRQGPRRPLLGVKTAQADIDALDARAATTDWSRSDLARAGVSIVATSHAARVRGWCGTHAADEDGMLRLDLPDGTQLWFCATTQALTQGYKHESE